MPSTSKAQHAFMEMSKSAAGRAKLKASGKKPAPVSVAKEFSAADKGRVGKLAKHARKK